MSDLDLDIFFKNTSSLYCGIVESFDKDEGLGTIKVKNFDCLVRFQLTQISDDSRMISLSAQVAFLLGFKGGSFEARSVVPLEK
jgi:cold shock CspA family protein